MNRNLLPCFYLGVALLFLVLVGCDRATDEPMMTVAAPASSPTISLIEKPTSTPKLPEPTVTEIAQNFKVFKNNKYYKDWILDVYLPTEVDPPYPTIVLISNLAWPHEYAETGAYFSQKDFAFVVADYDYFRWEKRIPCILAWVQTNSGEFGFDPTNIAVFGDGWGGIPAEWLGTVEDTTQFIDSCDYSPLDSKAIKGVIVWAGGGSKGGLCSSYRSLFTDMFDLSDPEIDEVCTALEDTPPLEWLDLAGSFDEEGSRYIVMRSLAWQDPDDPPILLLDYENNIKIRNSEDYANEVQALGGTLDFVTISEGKAGTLMEPDTPGFIAMWEVIDPFLAQIFE